MIIIDTSVKRELTLAPKTKADATAQELWILLSTIKGECPMYRGFGLNGEYLHQPVNMAQTAMTMAIIEALRKYMPDVEVVNISFKAQDGIAGILNPVVEVSDIE